MLRTASLVQTRASHGWAGPPTRSAISSAAPWLEVVWVMPVMEKAPSPSSARRRAMGGISGPGIVTQPDRARPCRSSDRIRL